MLCSVFLFGEIFIRIIRP
uniref:Uncharacterized protein n=1 Tax=Lepeophtheirus salmonis TaxID=72036 RepID=A0A0K2UTD8_LEPSM